MKLRTIVAVSSLLLLSSCFEMQQDVVVGDDGFTDVQWVVSVDAALMSMASQGKPDNFCSNVNTGHANRDVTITATRSTEKGDIVCAITMRGPTSDLFDALSEGKVLPGVSQSDGSGLRIFAKKEGDNTRFVVQVPPMPQRPGEDENMRNMLVGATSGRFLEWNFTAPQIIETSGKLSEDGKTATYSLPVASMMSNRMETYEFDVLFSDEPAGFAGWMKSLFQ